MSPNPFRLHPQTLSNAHIKGRKMDNIINAIYQKLLRKKCYDECSEYMFLYTLQCNYIGPHAYKYK